MKLKHGFLDQTHPARKYLNPNISESMREVNQFVRKNRGMKTCPIQIQSGTTSSRRLPNLPATLKSSIRPFCQGTDPSGNPLLPRHTSSPTSKKVTSSRRYVPQSPKDNQDVNRGRSASLLALSLATKKIWEISTVPEAPSRLRL